MRKSGFGLKSQVGVLKSGLTKDLTRIKTKILFYLNLVFVMFSLTSFVPSVPLPNVCGRAEPNFFRESNIIAQVSG